MLRCRPANLNRLWKYQKIQNIPPNNLLRFSGSELSNDVDTTITSPDYLTSIVIKNAKRAQSGMYTIRAVNEHGEDECDVEMVVLGPPDRPEGPMEISDVHKEGCKIK